MVLWPRFICFRESSLCAYHYTMLNSKVRTIYQIFEGSRSWFSGLWPIRNPQEMEEISQVFNLPVDVIQAYVQFGEIFNLLHAGASYLRIHQKGFGAVGVSKKYGRRSLLRYPIFWGLSRIGALPNPDPSDTAEWHKGDSHVDVDDDDLDWAAEANRGQLRVQAQKWAGLKIDPKAELFVFVGRWSMQKVRTRLCELSGLD